MIPSSLVNSPSPVKKPVSGVAAAGSLLEDVPVEELPDPVEEAPEPVDEEPEPAAEVLPELLDDEDDDPAAVVFDTALTAPLVSASPPIPTVLAIAIVAMIEETF